jgi:hypothetical protein
LQKAGITFADAQRFEKETNYYGHLPKYSEKSSWSDAVTRAKRLISKLENGNPIVGF